MGNDKSAVLAAESAKRRKDSEERRAKALALLATGVSAAAVAERLGLAADTVRSYARKAREAE